MSHASDFQNKPCCFTSPHFPVTALLMFHHSLTDGLLKGAEPRQGQVMYEITSVPKLLMHGYSKPFITLISGLSSADSAHKSVREGALGPPD